MGTGSPFSGCRNTMLFILALPIAVLATMMLGAAGTLLTVAVQIVAVGNLFFSMA